MALRNKFVLSFAISLLVFACKSEADCPDDQEKEWSYSGENGPSNWGEIGFPQCSGQQQSPIDIPSDATESSGKPLSYLSYSEPVNGNVENNGHTVQVVPTDGVSRGVTVGDSTYSLQQFHFHVGDGEDKNIGSEHKVAGQGYAMELHVVNMDDQNRYVVLGVFFEEGDTDNPDLDALIAAVNTVEYEGDSNEIEEPINLDSLLPECRNTYYTYEGSLTTPPCAEVATWFVLRQPVPISTRQLQAFRKQHSVPSSSEDADQCYLVNNFRPVQPLNGRSVTLYNSDCYP